MAGCISQHGVFQSTLPARGATQQGERPEIHAHFNPRSPHGERPRLSRASLFFFVDFNPRSPHGERRGGEMAITIKRLFQSTLPARGATRERPKTATKKEISIHAPRTGSDRGAPRMRRPAWNFNPRSPHGERQSYFDTVPHKATFQSTLPARGATLLGNTIWNHHLISIHAPRTGSDAAASRTAPAATDFNPRSPHGERRSRGRPLRAGAHGFQSTLPARGATIETLPRAEFVTDFNPRSPHGERLPQMPFHVAN